MQGCQGTDRKVSLGGGINACLGNFKTDLEEN